MAKPTRTPEQRIAALEAKLAKAKDDARKKRTRNLIEVGAMLEPLGDRVRALTTEQRATFIKATLVHFDRLAGIHQGEAKRSPSE